MAIRNYVTKDGTQLYEVHVAVRAPNGIFKQIKRRGFTSKREAQIQEFELKRELANKRDAPSAFITWGDWFQTCIDKMKLEFKPSTIMNYEGQLKKWAHPVWKNRLLKEITANDVHDLTFTIIEGVSMNCRKSTLKMVKRIFQMAVEEGVLDRNPALKIKVKVPESKQLVLNATEVEVLLREAKVRGHQFYEIWAVALMTGLRSGEMYALKWSDVDLENRRITVSQSWCSKNGFGPTKTYKSRIVPICGELEGLLKEMKLKNRPDDEFVLPHVQEWTRGSQAEVLRGFCQTVGITPVKFHDLRATFITQLLLRGVPLAQVMSIVGHTQIKTTNIYLRMSGADLTGVTDRLGFTVPRGQPAQVLEFRR